MKRILFVLALITCAVNMSAQDEIVMKDGNTKIYAKILKVSATEVEYKKFSNLDGPTYTISTKELSQIKYQNGEIDRFVQSTTTDNVTTPIVQNQNENNSANELEAARKAYNELHKNRGSGKTWKTVGWIAGGALVTTGVVLFFCASNDYHGFDIGVGEYAAYSLGATCAGVATWATCYFIGKHKDKQSQLTVQSTPIYQHNFKVGKHDNLTVGLDLLSNNMHRNHNLGIGLAYNF